MQASHSACLLRYHCINRGTKVPRYTRSKAAIAATPKRVTIPPMRRTILFSGALLAVLVFIPHQPVAGSSGQAIASAPKAGECSLNWIGHEAEIEKFLIEGKILKLEDVPIGVTKPQRATLEPGGPIGRFAWKALRPGYSKGFMESYKAEIAAYRMDRMLELHMVPPIVERTIDGRDGAAVMWIVNTKPWSVEKPPQGPEPMWSIQLTRMKMLDLLIANIDRNQGNLIYDNDWHLFLIDHSRAFISKKDLKGIAPLGRVDRALWNKMEALTLESLEAGLGEWVSTGDKKAILLRRDKMAEAINELIAKRGEKSVYYD